MRVIAGELKGQRLVAPRGWKVRPTSDRVREAIFSALGDRVEGASVADLYCGTGALAIEALSRGAASADFVELNPPSLRTLGANIAKLGADDVAHVAPASTVSTTPVIQRASSPARKRMAAPASQPVPSVLSRLLFRRASRASSVMPGPYIIGV